MNTMNRTKSTARIERSIQLVSSASLLVGALLALAVTIFPVTVQARDDNDNDRDDNPAYGYNRHYDPDARYPEGTYPRSDWDRYRGDYSGGYGPYNPNARFYEAPYAGGHRDHDHDHDHDHDGDDDHDQDDNHNDHSHHHHHHQGLFHNIF